MMFFSFFFPICDVGKNNAINARTHHPPVTMKFVGINLPFPVTGGKNDIVLTT